MILTTVQYSTSDSADLLQAAYGCAADPLLPPHTRATRVFPENHTIATRPSAMIDPSAKRVSKEEEAMTNSPQFPPYRSQLLRMWAESSPRCPPRWRFSLEDVATGQRCGFADLDALICHLLEQMDAPPDQALTERTSAPSTDVGK